jgi:voltage-gated potassium channel Kch
LYKYVGLEINPNKAIEARNKGLPVFYGDIGRPEVADAFGVEKAKAIIVTISDKNEANRAVIALRRKYPEKKIFARAVNADHAERLQRTLDVIAMVPIVPEDNVILSLPFGGAVLRSLGAAPEEVTAILESKRKEVLSGRKLAAEESLLELAQLGISPPSKEKDTKVADTKKAIDGEIVEEKKSPMVAEMIESISSSGADDESDDDNDNANNDQQ